MLSNLEGLNEYKSSLAIRFLTRLAPTLLDKQLLSKILDS
jgi:hypothetical protein